MAFNALYVIFAKWNDILNFEGTTGPYIQYTYARIKSILRKYGKIEIEKNINHTILTDNITFSLVKVLLQYEDIIVNASQKYEPSIIAKYLITLTSAFNRFYHECPILNSIKEERNARILLVDIVQKVIQDACDLLGIECPEEM